jgi:hypothetical protein
LDGSEALFFYFDLNSNEKLDENEKIQPLPRDDSSRENTYEFVTPDFLITTEDGRRIPFRTRLQTRFYTNREAVRCSWSPSCILEGTAQFGQQKKRLILFTGGFGPNFNTFGRSTYSLLNADADMKEHAGRQTLSSLINYEGTFYRMTLHGRHEQNSIVRVVLEKDTAPTGELAVRLASQERIDCKLRHATIRGADDNTIHFSIHGQATLPKGRYRLNRGSFTLSKPDDARWDFDFSQGPEMTVEAQKTCKVELGSPKMSITAVEANNRYGSDVKEMTEFKKGTKIYISPKVKGKTGELYGRLRRRNGRRNEDVKPEITIVGPDNTQIVSKQLEYG